MAPLYQPSHPVLLGLDLFPEWPDYVVLDILELAERAASETVSIAPVFPSPHLTALRALGPLAAAARATPPRVGLFFIVEAEGDALESAVGLGRAPVSRDRWVRYCEQYLRSWNEAVDALTESVPGATESSARGRAKARRREKTLARWFSEAIEAPNVDRIIYNPVRDMKALRYLAYHHVLHAHESEGVVARVTVGTEFEDEFQAVQDAATADALALVLLSAVHSPAFVELNLGSSRDFERWALTVARRAGCPHLDEASLYDSLGRSGIVSDRVVEGRTGGIRVKEKSPGRPTVVSDWVERLLARAHGLGW